MSASAGESVLSKNHAAERDGQANAASSATPPAGVENSNQVSSKMDALQEISGDWQEPEESSLRGSLGRIFQILARSMPGAKTLRVMLHRARGVKIGKGVWIGYDVILDTARPDLVTIEDGVAISMRATIIAHFKEFRGVRIERDAFIGPGAIILPNVVIGRGAVVTAGSVVSQSVPPMTVVQGNPAVPIARCGVAFRQDISLKKFSRNLKPLVPPKPVSPKDSGGTQSTSVK
ncbi:acyltransferase [Terracidiphilus sp.]|jgi:acetyltransferase-like isoleucine patch superfamily enzyme|uniref:acyltransferase n=1 Tax=Terracidiphilus sp. TaxID=1964191 RepID=UPI003C22DA02